jgi:hypothetical protein
MTRDALTSTRSDDSQAHPGESCRRQNQSNNGETRKDVLLLPMPRSKGAAANPIAWIHGGGTEGHGSRKAGFFPFNDGLYGIIIISGERILLGKILLCVEVFTTAEYSLVCRKPAKLRPCVK